VTFNSVDKGKTMIINQNNCSVKETVYLKTNGNNIQIKGMTSHKNLWVNRAMIKLMIKISAAVINKRSYRFKKNIIGLTAFFHTPTQQSFRIRHSQIKQ